MKIDAAEWAKVEAHFKRPCELNEHGQILYQNADFPVGYLAEGDWAGWLVDSTGDRDALITKIAS